MSKNIVICCDGTGNEFGNESSNVVKLYSVLRTGPTQVAYYHPGVGTMGARAALTRAGKTWTRIVGLAFGYGLSENIGDAYQFLMNTYEDGDRVFVFGFSRGAYTARALCGMLHMFGLMSRGNEGMIPYAIRLFKAQPPDLALAGRFKETFSREVRPHFLGVWDTVSSVGWIYNAVHFPFTTENPDPRFVRHAVAIDERRTFYRQNLFRPSAGQTVDQVWFVGAHSDVGGSYPEHQSGLSKITLAWMMDGAELRGLEVNQNKKAQVLGDQAPPDPAGHLHRSLRGWWYVAELWPKIVHAGGTHKKRLRINRGRARFIPPDAVIHESVRQRMALPSAPVVSGKPPATVSQEKYTPTNLPPMPVETMGV